MQNVTFHDHKPANLNFQQAVIDGLSQEFKSIPPKFFYDERGSQLFDQICEQPEYYPPKVERRMLADLAQEIASLTGTGRLLFEPGAGSAAKVRLILDALHPAAFVPMDISFDYLKSVATGLAREYPWLPVHAVCVDFTHSLPIPAEVPVGPRLLFFPGSSMGNFNQNEAGQFLDLVRETVGDDGMLLIGVDTKKCESRLNAAYNDKAGITAQFNLNLLHRMRQELETDLDPENFEHRAFYNAKAGRIEMHLVSRAEQQLRINGHCFRISEGESLHTENSYKYTPDEFLGLAAQSRFRRVRHWVDSDGLFAIYLLATDRLPLSPQSRWWLTRYRHACSAQGLANPPPQCPAPGFLRTRDSFWTRSCCGGLDAVGAPGHTRSFPMPQPHPSASSRRTEHLGLWMEGVPGEPEAVDTR